MSLLLTGSSGFVGKYLLQTIIANGDEFKLLNRRALNSVTLDKQFLVDDFRAIGSSEYIFTGIRVVVHCAARVHVMKETTLYPLEAFREVNVLGTINLAKSAAQAGVKRFIFISSIKVNGESTTRTPPYLSSDKPSPEDSYGVSKAEAEEQLLILGKQTGMEIVIIRPPLVYGAGVKANFAAICKLVAKGLPLPFSSLRTNKRSMVYVGNLVSLIIDCINNDKAANQVFLVSDNDDLSLADFIKRLSVAMDKKTILLPFPKFLFELVGKLTGKSAVVDRLVGSLQVDITHTCKTLDWQPPYSVEEGFKATVKDFQK